MTRFSPKWWYAGFAAFILTALVTFAQVDDQDPPDAPTEPPSESPANPPQEDPSNPPSDTPSDDSPSDDSPSETPPGDTPSDDSPSDTPSETPGGTGVDGDTGTTGTTDTGVGEEEVIPKDEKVENATISGEVVDLWGYLTDGSRGAEDKERASASATAGNPLGIVDARGIVYLVLAQKENTAANTFLMDKIGETVTVTGTRIRRGGASAIYITSTQ